MGRLLYSMVTVFAVILAILFLLANQWDKATFALLVAMMFRHMAEQEAHR